jgi:NTP pyrophosphatase (non-canonical NTP hydrolase)
MNIDEQFWSVDDWHDTADSEQDVETSVVIMLEEVFELRQAKKDDDLVEIADALGDILVTLYGVVRAVHLEAAEYNLPIDKIFKEIMDSNWSKFDGTVSDPVVLRREDGKILKGENYFKPRLQELLDEYYSS